MQSSTTQVRVTLPQELHRYLLAKADTFGLSMSSYVKHLILTDVKQGDVPVFQASIALERSYAQAVVERTEAKEHVSLDDFFGGV